MTSEINKFEMELKKKSPPNWEYENSKKKIKGQWKPPFINRKKYPKLLKEENRRIYIYQVLVDC